MKLLISHNFYQQPGGEDSVMQAENALLCAASHRVVAYVRHNDEISDYGLWQKVTLAPHMIWAWDSYRQLKTLLQKEKPNLAHFHNTLPLISPAAYKACREAGVPVVQTLHNYRRFCPAGTFFHDGQICEECVQHTLWQGIRYACYRNSRPATATVTLMLAVHRRRRTPNADRLRVHFGFGGLSGHEARVVEISALCVQNRQERYPVGFSMVVARFKAAQSGVGTEQ